MDPQQRILLEVVYEALENAGIILSDIAGSNTSVFCGSFTNDWKSMITTDTEVGPSSYIPFLLANLISAIGVSEIRRHRHRQLYPQQSYILLLQSARYECYCRHRVQFRFGRLPPWLPVH